MNDFIEHHYDQWAKYLKKYIPETEVCDVINDVLVSIYDRNFDLMKLDRPDLYVIKACRRAWFSRQSNYSRRRGRNYPTSPLEDYSEVLIVEEEDDTKTAEEIIYIIDHSPFCWWEKELFKRKALEGKTLDEMALECNLSKGQVWYSYNKVRMWLQKNLYKINI